MKGLVTAFRTLSILPVPGQDAEDYASSLPWFPVVGFVLGTVLVLFAILFNPLPPGAAAGLLLLLGVIVTRGFHLDGLADCADGFGGGYTKERILEIMKDSATGAFGAIAISLSLLLKWIALTQLLITGNLIVILLAYTFSRSVLVDLMVRFRYARKNGTAVSFVKGATQTHQIIALLAAVTFAIVLSGVTGIIYFSISWLLAIGIGYYAKRRINGITGDVLGATNELVETLVLFLPLFI